MAKNSKKTYWPHMILGFLFLGMTLSYWTVKSASSMPVQESNNYMLKYQQADMNINEIIQKRALFDQAYRITLMDVKRENIALENSKRAKDERVVILSKGSNSFRYKIEAIGSHPLEDANVTFLLTRPHTRREDRLIANISPVEGEYRIKDIEIEKAGRYILQLRVNVGEAIGYLEQPAYLKS